MSHQLIFYYTKVNSTFVLKVSTQATNVTAGFKKKRKKKGQTFISCFKFEDQNLPQCRSTSLLRLVGIALERRRPLVDIIRVFDYDPLVSGVEHNVGCGLVGGLWAAGGCLGH